VISKFSQQVIVDSFKEAVLTCGVMNVIYGDHCGDGYRKTVI